MLNRLCDVETEFQFPRCCHAARDRLVLKIPRHLPIFENDTFPEFAERRYLGSMGGKSWGRRKSAIFATTQGTIKLAEVFCPVLQKYFGNGSSVELKIKKSSIIITRRISALLSTAILSTDGPITWN